jgi:acyl carrier protein
VHEKPGIRAVMGDIIDAIIDEKPGLRDGRLNLNVDSIDAIRLGMKYEADINMF